MAFEMDYNKLFLAGSQKKKNGFWGAKSNHFCLFFSGGEGNWRGPFCLFFLSAIS